MNTALALIDEWIYIDGDGVQGVFGYQEAKRNLCPKIKSMKAAFLDYQIKEIVTGISGENVVKETFDKDCLVCTEQISTNTVQILSARNATISKIYNSFEGIELESLVPYAVAVRAYLKYKGLFSEQCIVFLDDLQNQTLLTIFNGNSFSDTRKISLRDINYIISEIKRTWMSFMVDSQNDKPFFLVSNNLQWVESLINEGFLAKDKVIHTASSYVALDGLKNAKFSIHFSPAQEILKKKKHQLFLRNTQMLSTGLLFVLSGFLFFWSHSLLYQKEKSKLILLKVELDDIKEKVSKVNERKYLSTNKQSVISYGRIYYDLISYVPPSSIIDSLKLLRDGEVWSLEADFYSEEAMSKNRFGEVSFFKNARVLPNTVNKFSGQRLMLKFKAKEV